jgi:hypothetical protein
MATATAMGDCNGNGNRVCNSNGDGDGNGNGNGHGEGNHYKGRVASSCGGDVQHFWRGNTLLPPPWIQRKVHSPALRHGGDTAKSVCSPSRGRVPDSSPWIVFVYFLQLLFSLLNNPLFAPPHYSGAQEPCQPIDALPPPLLQEPRQPIDNPSRLLLHFLSR